MDCDISIVVPQNYTIALYFSTFMYNCEGDQGMKIFDGSFTTGTMRNYCGYVAPDPFFSSGNAVSLRFRKQDIGTFDITYLASDKGPGCGGSLFNYFGAFTSPQFPNTDRSPSDCRWDIRVPSNLRVSLRFALFDMGNKQYCANDYVILYDVTEEGDKEITRFCGGDNPAPIIGSTSAMALRFVKTVNFDGSGFKVDFMGVFESEWVRVGV